MSTRNHHSTCARIATAMLIAAVAFSLAVPASARTARAKVDGDAQTIEVRATGMMEIGFSPEGSARALVLKIIQSAQPGGSLLMMAYALTAPDIVQAMIERRKAGVNVAVIADYKENLTGRGAGRAALNALVLGGVQVRTVSIYPIHHDKTIITGSSVEWGSFNYTAAAEKSNSENATVAWDNPALAAAYVQHWKSRWDQGQDYQPNF